MRQANLADIAALNALYESARAGMLAQGNSQWGNHYPTDDLLTSDIAENNLYVLEQPNGEIIGVFALIFGEDPTYRLIRQGSWLNKSPYGAIHRFAVHPLYQGQGIARCLFHACEEYARQQGISQLRIDTHAKNKVMQHVITRAGYHYCGIITASDGGDRKAYQKSLSET